MNASLTEEQKILRETVAAIAADLGPRAPGQLPAVDAGEAHWAQLAQAGILGMRVPESAGGMPMSGVDAVLVAEELGRRLVPLPFVGSALCAPSLLAAAGASTEVLGRLAQGRLRLAPVLDPTLERLALHGEPGVAWEARGADAGLVLDPATRRPVAVRLGERLHAVDLTRELRGVEAQTPAVEVGDLGAGIADQALDRVLALTLAALCGDLVGVMQGALDAAVAHVATRVQFGAPVGSFQAVQHMAAEAHVSTEGARGLAWYAGWAVDELDAGEALLAARTAKAYCAAQAREVVEAALQMHGGIAFTWESMMHVMVRRVLLGRQALGDDQVQLEALAELRATHADARGAR